MFGAGGSALPDDATVLPHGPAVPNAVEICEAVWGEGSAGDGALGAAGAVEGEPIGGAADDGFLLRTCVAKAGAQAIAVFQIGDGIDTGALVDAGDEFHEAVGGREGVEIADEEEALPGESFRPADGFDAIDEIICLEDGILIHGDVVVGSDHHACVICGFDEIGKFGIEQWAFGRACDECQRSVFAHGGDIEF